MGPSSIKKMKRYRSGWPWNKFRGSEACLWWNFRDLANLDFALGLVRGHDVAVQAGGNLGIFPKRLAEIFKKVYTFEPDPILFSHLRHNAPEKNIVAAQVAIGCSHEPVSLECHRRDLSGKPNHEGLTHVSGSGDIPQVMIDDLELKACDIIYLDIEGFEFNALRGAVKTIAKYRPVLGVEINSNIAYYSSDKREIRSWIENLGYKKVARVPGDDIYVPVKP